MTTAPSLFTLMALSSLPLHYTAAQSTLSTVLSNRNDIALFNELLDASGFSSGILRNVGSNVTVFAPKDDAIEAFPVGVFSSLLDAEWTDHTTCFVSYHTVEGSHLASNLQVGTELTTVGGDTLLVSSANPTQIDGATIVEQDIVASNGVAHVLDAVLMPPCAAQNIYQQLNTTDDFSTMAQLIDRAGLFEMISTTAPMTLFAPPNQAWQDMGERFITSLSNPDNLVFLKSLLMNHVVMGNWYESRLQSNTSFTLETSLGTTAFFFKESTTNFVTNSEIIESDILASNGVIHKVNPVTILAAVADLLLNAPVVSDFLSFSNFTSALMQANFFDALFLDNLNAPRTTTVFAPDDTAFAKISPNVTAKLLDPNWSFHLRELLRYHLADGTIQSDALSQLTTLNTLTNFSLEITMTSNALMVNTATVLYPDLVAYNGVIHGVDQVLFPPSLTTSILEQLTANPEFSTFLGLLHASVNHNITSLLQGDGPMTLFVPTNDAFENITISLYSPEEVTMMLEYHVAAENVFLNELPDLSFIPTVLGRDVTLSIQTSTEDTEENIQYLDNAQVVDGGVASNGVLYVLNQVLFPDMPTEFPTVSPAPTWDGYIAPSNVPSQTPVMNTWPGANPDPTTETTPSTSDSAVRRCCRVLIVSLAAILSCLWLS